MRSFVGFLLFEDLLDNLPNGSFTFTSFATYLFNPVVKVTAPDCGTTLGKIETIDYSIEGILELSTGLALTQARLNTLLAQGIYKINTRDLHSCTQSNGICVLCYRSTFPDYPVPTVGTQLTIPSRYILNHDLFRGDNTTTTFSLSYASTSYTLALVFINGTLQIGTYTITNQQLVLNSAPAQGVDVVVKYFIVSAKPFLNYLAKGYGGSIMGMQSLPTEPIVLRESLIKSLISQGQIDTLRQALPQFPAIDPLYITFTDKITDKLEKAIYMLCLYGIFSNANP